MIDTILEQYEKYGWTLRRILLKEAVRDAAASELKTKYPHAELRKSEIDALWFSRRNGDAETWELRRLAGTPFALLEVFQRDVSDEDREGALRNVEIQMAETLTKSPREIPLEK